MLIASTLMIITAMAAVLVRATMLDTPDAPPPPVAAGDWCEQAKALGDLNGKTVDIYSVTPGIAATYQAAYQAFTECTGAPVTFEASPDFGAQVLARVQSSPPDVVLSAQPGLLSQLVNETGKVVPLPAVVSAFAGQYFPDAWLRYGRVNGTQFGIPNNADLKSMVFYSPKNFTAKGFRVPTSWSELQALQSQITAAGGKPWCLGINAGTSTGWMITDWLEDYVLRTAGPDVYDQWISHDIKFTDPRIAAALKQVGDVLKNSTMVNAGFGDVQSIATTAVRDPVAKVVSGECTLWKAAATSTALFPQGTTFGPNGDIDAFYLPPISNEFGETALGSGSFYAALNDRPEVQAFLLFAASPEYANARAAQGGFISANSGLQAANVSNPILNAALARLRLDTTVFRFDASDLMPIPVGLSAEWQQFTAWINGQDDATTLSNIDQAWPS